MSLADPDDEYSELVPKGAGKLKKSLKRARFYFLFLFIGILVGVYLQHAFFGPFFSGAMLDSCADCVVTKELLNKENSCLYDLISDPQTASLRCNKTQESFVDNLPDSSSQETAPANLPKNSGETNYEIADSNENEPSQADLSLIQNACISACLAIRESDFDFNTGGCFGTMPKGGVCLGMNLAQGAQNKMPDCANPWIDGEARIVVQVDENCNFVTILSGRVI